METSDVAKLQLLCASIKSKGVNDADAKAAADGLEASLVGVPDSTFNEKESSEPSTATASSGGLRLVDLVLRGVLQLVRNSETAVTSAAHGGGGVSRHGVGTPEDLKQQLYDLAITFEAVAECWGCLAGKEEESHKLAVAEAATTSGVFEALTRVSTTLIALLPKAPDNKKLARSLHLKLAVSLVSLWHSFVKHWPSASSVLTGRDEGTTLLSRSFASLICVLLRVLSKAMHSSAVAADDPILLSAFNTAMDGCLAVTRCIAKDVNNSAASSIKQSHTEPTASDKAALQFILAKHQMHLLYALGAGFHIWFLRKALYVNVAYQIFDRGDQAVSIRFPRGPLNTFKDLLRTLQLPGLCTALVKYLDSAWESHEVMHRGECTLRAGFRMIYGERYPAVQRAPMDWHPTTWIPNSEEAIAWDVVNGIAHVCTAVSKTPAVHHEAAEQQQQQQQMAHWLEAIEPLLSQLEDLQSATLEAVRQCYALASDSGLVVLSTSGDKALLALDAMLAVRDLQLCQTAALTGAPAAASRSSSSNYYKQIIASMATIEESLRSAASVRLFAQQLLKEQARRTISILAQHSKQLQGVSVALDKSVWSLTLTCLKLAQAYSTIQTADAAVLAQHILQESMQLYQLKADAVATRQRQTASHAAGQSQQSTHHATVLILLGRISVTIGTILQHTGHHVAIDRHKQPLEEPQLSAILAVASQLNPWLETAVGRIRDSTMPSLAEKLLSALQQQLQKPDIADDQAAADASEESADVSDTDATDQSQDTLPPAGCHAKGLALARLGAALSSEFPVSYCCNNPDCVNMALESELMLVRQKGSVCSACQKARYCSKACQKQHWKQHKPVCKRLRSAAA